MQNQNKDKNYQDYYLKILTTLQEDLQTKKINVGQLLLILLSIRHAQTKEQLQAAIEDLSNAYPQLDEVKFKEMAAAKDDYEHIIQKIALDLIMKGKTRESTEFTVYASEHGFEETKARYPQYFN